MDNYTSVVRDQTCLTWRASSRSTRTTGLHLQQTGWTCGPCALLNVLAMNGATPNLTEEDLAAFCETDPVSGTDNDMMVSAARAAGLEVVSVTTGATPEDIDWHLRVGHRVIVNFRHAFDGDGHFAVIAESDDDAFYLRDSSLGLPTPKPPST